MHPQTVLPSAAAGIDFAAVKATRERILKAGLALNTQLCYASGWKAFTHWCSCAKRDALPASAETLEDFAAWCIGEHLRLKTVTNRLRGIAHYHREAGLPSPVAASVSAFIAKAKRDLKEDPGGKAAVTRFHIIEIAKRLKNDPIQIRNRAMILVTFASGWRRSESTGLLYSDVRFVKEGMTLWLRKSKTDQEGKGRLVGIHSGRSAVACPVRALKAWLKIRGKWDGPLFVAFTPRRAITRDGLGGRG